MEAPVDLTVHEALVHARGALSATSDSARHDAHLLLGMAMGRDRAWILAHGDDRMTAPQLREFERLCELRATGMPVAYIVGFSWFYAREMVVNDAVLVPRPETEHLVDDAVAYLRASHHDDRERARVLDVGTGSGAIGCNVAAEVAFADVDCVDVSERALVVARKNAERFRVDDRCAFFLGDLVEPVRGRTYDVVAANLPYVPTADVPERPNPVGFEPRVATDGGPDGLALYRRLLASAPQLLRAEGLLLMEAAPPVMPGLLALTHAAFPDATVEVRNDYANCARYVRVKASAP